MQNNLLAGRKPRCLQEILRAFLIHSRRGSEHARADISNAGKLKEPLNRAVLAVRTVENREDDVDGVENLAGAITGDEAEFTAA